MTHTRSLWRMCTECMMVFPDGIAVLPWMMGGTESIGQATAEKMKGIPAWSVSSRGNFYMRWGFCACGFYRVAKFPAGVIRHYVLPPAAGIRLFARAACRSDQNLQMSSAAG